MHIQASKGAKGGQVGNTSMQRLQMESGSDVAARCSTVQLAWLDLLQDLTGFFTKELKLLMNLCASPELLDFYQNHQQSSVWESGVKNMQTVLSEVCCPAEAVRGVLGTARQGHGNWLVI